MRSRGIGGLLLLLIAIGIGQHSVQAQWYIAPRVIVGTHSANFDEGNSYSLPDTSGYVKGLEVSMMRKLTRTLSLSAGVGMHWATNMGEDCGNMSYAPVYIGARLSDGLFVEGALGYNATVGSGGLGVVSGYFGRIGGGLDLDEIVLGLSIDIMHRIGNLMPTYVPDGFMPMKSGVSVMVYLEYKFQLGEKSTR